MARHPLPSSPGKRKRKRNKTIKIAPDREHGQSPRRTVPQAGRLSINSGPRERRTGVRGRAAGPSPRRRPEPPAAARPGPARPGLGGRGRRGGASDWLPWLRHHIWGSESMRQLRARAGRAAAPGPVLFPKQASKQARKEGRKPSERRRRRRREACSPVASVRYENPCWVPSPPFPPPHPPLSKFVRSRRAAGLFVPHLCVKRVAG